MKIRALAWIPILVLGVLLFACSPVGQARETSTPATVVPPGAPTSAPAATALPPATATGSPTAAPAVSPTTAVTRIPTGVVRGTPTVGAAAQGTPQIVPTDISSPILAATAQATADLAKMLKIPASDISVKSAKAVEWPDNSLGCPQPGFMYSQIVTPGFKIVLTANGKDYNYHAGLDMVVYCEQ